uniref:shugoshin-1-like isoform X3 n=1 Tax=Fragaria vesca subsp. vesca TaxID=101020 RepID=UPI0005C9288A|nr:PREDICTED: shugoshin-1-like isoform X3 [Fragaria vesca subsp. vesca]
MRAARMATRSSVNTTMRPKLADVTNLPAPPSRNENLSETSMGDKDRVEQLTRERMALIKLVTERNKIIELSGAELQKLRVGVQKLQLQNWNLARSNSQMLAELNSKRDTVKTLQHELLCKEALLKAKNSEMQEKSEMKCQNVRSKFKEPDEVTLHEADNDDKPRIGNKRRATRSQSMGSSTTGQNNEQKDKVENKRRSLRRQSSRFKSDEEEQTETLFEIEEAKFPENRMLEVDPIPSISSTKQEEKEDSWAAKSEGVSQRSSIGRRPLRKAVKKDTEFPEKLIPNCDPTPLILSTNKEKAEISAPKSEGVSQRCSVGRPMRKAVEKVQSYKEPPLHVKMRRAE